MPAGSDVRVGSGTGRGAGGGGCRWARRRRGLASPDRRPAYHDRCSSPPWRNQGRPRAERARLGAAFLKGRTSPSISRLSMPPRFRSFSLVVGRCAGSRRGCAWPVFSRLALWLGLKQKQALSGMQPLATMPGDGQCPPLPPAATAPPPALPAAHAASTLAPRLRWLTTDHTGACQIKVLRHGACVGPPQQRLGRSTTTARGFRRARRPSASLLLLALLGLLLGVLGCRRHALGVCLVLLALLLLLLLAGDRRVRVSGRQAGREGAPAATQTAAAGSCGGPHDPH